MLEALATVFLLGAMAAFAVLTVLLNESGHGRGRRKRGDGATPPTGRVVGPFDEARVGGVPTDDRRLPVGDFLFGALFLHGPDALAFPALADAAAASGMSTAQVLDWIDRAEEGGLIERIEDGGDGEPAVRLTELGIYIACNDRRRGKRSRKPDASPAARALNR